MEALHVVSFFVHMGWRETETASLCYQGIPL